ncbi:hypothetical protein OH687_38295 [Burkholderia anthina]|nr:hypothetical protein OH687_38295 [Burkholderia anthina]
MLRRGAVPRHAAPRCGRGNAMANPHAHPAPSARIVERFTRPVGGRPHRC